ncbi:MAG: hypothetical protein HDQ96_14460 [Lachnospiraceae bacterium]|nr:hypothetical protein [Lachnospiraceae bacterium]
MTWNEEIFKCRRCSCIILFILCTVLLCGCGDNADGPEAEEYERIEKYKGTEEYEGTEADSGVAVPAESQIPDVMPIRWEEVELHEIPENGYHNRSYGYYVCWKDILVLRDDIYRKENGAYRRTGQTASGLLDEEEIGFFGICQYHNLMITALCDDMRFVLFDLDTWEKSEYRLPEGEEFDYTCWYIYEGKIYYVKSDSLCAWSIEEKTEEEIYVLHDAGKNRNMGRFMICDDGTIIAAIHDRREWTDYQERSHSYISKREFWKLSQEDRQRAATKLWETSEIEFIYWLDFNGEGLFFCTECYDIDDSGYMCLTEEGEVEKRREYVTEALMFAEDGFYTWDGIRPNTVSKYDFYGYKVAEYRLLDEELEEEGYSIKAALFQEDKITVFVEHNETDKLYIRQIQTADESENMFVNDNFESEWISSKSTVEGYQVTGYDREGNEVFEVMYKYKRPKVSELTEEIYQIDLEWAVSREEKGKEVWFFNKETSEKSEYYPNPVMTDEKYVAYMEDNTLVVTDLFRKGDIYMEIKRDFTQTADQMDAILNMEVLDENHVKVEYLEGSEAEKVTEVIEMGNGIQQRW